MLSCFFFFVFKKKFAKGLDRTVLTSSCGPTPVLTVHGITKKSGSLGLKNRFPFRFLVFIVRPPGPVRFWKPWSIVAHRSWYSNYFEFSFFAIQGILRVLVAKVNWLFSQFSNLTGVLGDALSYKTNNHFSLLRLRFLFYFSF